MLFTFTMAWLDKISIFILCFLVLSVAIFDIRERRIPNFLVFPAVFVAIVLHSLDGGLSGGLFALKGMGVGLCLLLIPYLVKGMKAGDVKFVMAIGAFLGPIGVIRVILITLLFYPLLAFVIVIRERKLRITLVRFLRILLDFLGLLAPSLKLYAVQLESCDDKSIASVTTPFGVAIAIGTLISVYTGFLITLF